MDGLSNQLGTRQITFVFDDAEGKDKFTFTVIVLDGYAEKEQYILSLCPSPLQLVTTLPDNTPAHIASGFMEKALELAMRPQYITRTEEKKFDMALHGLAWSLWRGLRDNHAEFGKYVEGSKVVYTTPDGTDYTVTPEEGVTLMYKFIERAGVARFKELVAIRDGIEEPPELGKSSGSETTTETKGQDTGDTPGQSLSEPSSSEQTGPSPESES